jgi:hypothetical protein
MLRTLLGVFSKFEFKPSLLIGPSKITASKVQMQQDKLV